MRKLGVILVLFSFVLLLSSLTNKQADDGSCSLASGNATRKSSGPPGCFAGEPPNNTDCTSSGCHDDGKVNTGTALVTLDLGAANNGFYTPGETYTITVSISRPGLARAGFQLIALQDNNISISPGTIVLTDDTRTQLIDKDNPHLHTCTLKEKTWVEHTLEGTQVSSPGFNSWSFQWKAPDKAAGSITFYLASLEANNNLEETGDLAYTLKKTISPSVSSLPGEEVVKEVSVYPNPAAGELHIRLKDPQYVEAISLYNELGECISSLEKNTIGTKKLDFVINTTGLSPGMYVLKVKGTGGLYVKKVIVNP